jgi:signal transduction histidine kinase
MSVETDGGGAAALSLGDILTADEPVWVWDIEARRILWANRAGRAFWGAETLETLRERRFDARSKALSRMAALAGGPDVAREWTESLALPGRADRAPVTCHMQAMQVAGGRPGLIVRALDRPPARARPRPARTADAPDDGNAADSVALKHIAARLKQAQVAKRGKPRAPEHRAAPPAAALPDALIRELCHELRNPLTVILGFAERIRDSDPVRARAAIKTYAGNILEGAHFALEILSDLSARLHRGETAPPPAEPADVHAAVATCLRLIAPLARQAGMSVSKSVGRSLPRLRAEERALKQILLNVLVNAVRHQKTGGRIAVTARMRRDRSLLLAVSDDGIGMTKKEIKAALSGGRRANGEAGGQSGIGLPLVKRLVESAGGDLSIESARRKGTTVAMRFPPASLVSHPAPKGADADEAASSLVCL